jgi:hypothetical protein
MAEFFANNINVGTDTLPQFQVYITMSNCGVRDGQRVAITNCATIDELNEEVKRLVQNLYKARDIAIGYLEENEGEI